MTQYSGIFTLQQQAQLQSTGQWSHEPYFNSTTLLIHADDALAGAQNNTFIDSSSGGNTITRNGTPTQGTFTPYGNVWSNYFNGSSDYLTAAANAAFNFGTGDFTVEAWVYIAANSALDGLSRREALVFALNADTFVFTIDGNSSTTGTGLSLYNGSGGPTVSGTINQNVWNHIAVSRSGASAYFWLNGTQMGATQSITGSWGSSTQTAFIGQRTSPSYTFPLNGYVSNLRVVKGTALYTAPFNPSTTPLTAITNTSLLTCQSNRFADNSTNAFAITANGTPTVQRFAPFSPSSGYAPSVYGGGGYFSSTSTDYLSVASGSGVNLTTNNFTFECWFYKITDPANAANLIWWNGNTNLSSNAGLRVQLDPARTISLLCSESGSAWQINATSTATYSNNAWNHVAVVRSGATVTLYLNGVSIVSGSLSSSSASLYAGTLNYINNMSFSSGTWSMIGYVSNARLVNGSAVYTGGFTPPASPVTAITNTTLLLDFTNAGVYDNGMQNNLTTVGDAQVSTAVVKYGSGSMKFDGTGDYVSTPISNNFVFGSGDFTIEGWFYKSAQVGPVDTIVTYGWTSTTSAPFVILYNGSNQLQFYASSNGSSWDIANAVSMGTFTTGQWNHFAVSRQGSSIRLFMNGVLQNTATSSASLYVQTTYPLTIGGNGNGGNLMNGYIDDFRITKGVARYISNFTPPQVAMANQ